MVQVQHYVNTINMMPISKKGQTFLEHKSKLMETIEQLLKSIHFIIFQVILFLFSIAVMYVSEKQTYFCCLTATCDKPDILIKRSKMLHYKLLSFNNYIFIFYFIKGENCLEMTLLRSRNNQN